MEAEPERDLTRSADGSGIGLNNEFPVQKILHIEEHIRRLMHLAGDDEIHCRKTAEASSAIVRVVIVLSAGVVVRSADIDQSFVGVRQARGSTVPRNLWEEITDQCGIGIEFRDSSHVIDIGRTPFPVGEHPVFGIALNPPDMGLAHVLTLLRDVRTRGRNGDIGNWMVEVVVEKCVSPGQISNGLEVHSAFVAI